MDNCNTHTINTKVIPLLKGIKDESSTINTFYYTDNPLCSNF